MFFLYSLLFTIAFLLMTPLFLIRQGKYGAGFWQRFGRYPEFKQDERPVIWLHCVSVGETNAARPLVDEIKQQMPGYRLIVSTTTKTGQKLAKDIFKDKAEMVFYFPFDWRFTVRRALRTFKPKLVLLMETELWFNFLREGYKSGAQIVIVNGRISEKSFRRYSLIGSFMKRVLVYVEAALMQDNASAKHLMKLGARGSKVKVTGNLKFDHNLGDAEMALTNEFRNRFHIRSDAPLVIAASTHAPEEKWLLEAFRDIWKTSSHGGLPRLMIAPRHPERFAEVAALLKESGFDWVLRSEEPSGRDATAEVILLDSIGELRAAYPLAELVFVGGSLIPRGGQSILEPAVWGKAIVTGHNTKNFQAVVDEFLSREALVQLPELSEKQVVAELAKTLGDLLRDSGRRELLGESARKVMERNRGATAKTIEQIKFALANPSKY
jgi:3-deoxy-D-manno-octulosonic-acid transferase